MGTNSSIRATLTAEFNASIKSAGADERIRALTIRMWAATVGADAQFDFDKSALTISNFTTRQDAEAVLQKLQGVAGVESAYIPSKPTFF